jgi:transposase
MTITTIGIDLAKNVFHVHGIDASGEVQVRRSLRRGQVLPFFQKLPPCLVGMEACGTSHYWAREIASLGHDVRLMPPAYVKAYVKRGKSDALDAEAISEAVLRPSMRFVAAKSPQQQAVLMLHRSRDLLVRQRTQLVNMIRAQLAEFGITVRKGVHHALKVVDRLLAGEAVQVPALALTPLMTLAELVRSIQQQIVGLEGQLMVWFRGSERARRLATIPGIGYLTATALAATVTEPQQFSSGRQFAAWLGLTPRQNSSGGKEQLGRISKMGDRYLRRLLVVSMTSRIAAAIRNLPSADPWLAAMLARKPRKLVAVALANKTARIVWAVMVRGESYRNPQPSAQIVAA